MFAVLWEDGSIEFYCDGDVRVPLATLRKLVFKADRFMLARDNG